MKLAFFGTSDRSTPILDAIKHKNLVLCITKRDRIVGRKHEVKEAGVKKWAKENNISYFELNSLKNGDLSNLLKELDAKEVDMGIVCDFSFIIPKELIERFKDKLVNIHFSLLPKYRGASPVQQSLLNGDKTTGITYQLLGEKLDEGDILYQLEVQTDNTDTSGSLYNKMFNIAGKVTPEFIDKFSRNLLIPVKQEVSEATYTYSKTNPKSTQISKEDAKIDWIKPTSEIEKMCRAYFPWPVAWTYLKDLENNPKISERIQLKDPTKKDQTVKLLEVRVKNGLIDIIKIQPENKNIMDWNSFKNGYTK